MRAGPPHDRRLYRGVGIGNRAAAEAKPAVEHG